MNKYQEALDYLTNFLEYSFNEKYRENIGTLQELIFNMEFVKKVQTPDYIRVQNENEKLEKALDKACEYLPNNCPIKNPTEIGCDTKCENCWKEYLLKESEKQ